MSQNHKFNFLLEMTLVLIDIFNELSCINILFKTNTS